jgi:sulfatase modifying factor 1
MPIASRLGLMLLLSSLASSCRDSTPTRKTVDPATRAMLAAEADPATWEDLQPETPGQRLRDPRTGIVFRRIGRGRFPMGSDDTDLERPLHSVTLTHDYLLAETEVTIGQWRRFVDEHGGPPEAPLPRKPPQHPMTHLLFAEAAEFCACYGYRLPTEAEWERACRAGLPAEGPWSSERTLEDHAWFHLNCQGTQPVGTRQPNQFGLCDMLGNVWEYCSDQFVAGYGAGTVQRTDPAGPEHGLGHALRGGSWFTLPGPTPAIRVVEESDPLTRRNGFTGFRPARPVD